MNIYRIIFLSHISASILLILLRSCQKNYVQVVIFCEQLGFWQSQFYLTMLVPCHLTRPSFPILSKTVIFLNNLFVSRLDYRIFPDNIIKCYGNLRCNIIVLHYTFISLLISYRKFARNEAHCFTWGGRITPFLCYRCKLIKNIKLL